MLAHVALEGVRNSTGQLRHRGASVVVRAAVGYHAEVARFTLLAGLCAVAAGCGGPHPDAAKGIRRALEASPFSYLHYGRVWWGRDPHVSLQSLHIRGRRAFVVLAARDTVVQHLLLLQGPRGGWRVTIPGQPGLVTGPLLVRPATPSERRRIVARYAGCTTYDVTVSQVDETYALVQFPSCARYNGEVLFHRGARGWLEVDAASEPFDCTEAPPGVIRSLAGGCWTA